MTIEPNGAGDQAALEELEQPLRQAVECVRDRPVPEDALRRALDCARSVKSPTVSKAHLRPSGKQPRRRLLNAVSVTGLVCMLAAAALLVVESVEQARESARRTRSRTRPSSVSQY